MNFSTIDWVILVAYLAATVAVGIRAKRYVEDLSGYMVAGRRVRLSLGVATFAATELGTITFMYFSELGYVSGFSCFIIGILALLAYMFVGKTGFIIEPLRRLEVMTIPEFYQMRYSRRVRLLGGIILFLGGVLNMGIFLKFDGIFLSEVMGFGPDALVLIMTLMLLVLVLYTILVGMFSVVVTGDIGRPSRRTPERRYPGDRRRGGRELRRRRSEPDRQSAFRLDVHRLDPDQQRCGRRALAARNVKGACV
jgi:SSS family solute:Na+ symporter